MWVKGTLTTRHLFLSLKSRRMLFAGNLFHGIWPNGLIVYVQISRIIVVIIVFQKYQIIETIEL